jgi:hypothetical protein
MEYVVQTVDPDAVVNEIRLAEFKIGTPHQVFDILEPARRHVVQAHNATAVRQETFAQVRTDETCPSGHQRRLSHNDAPL